MKTFDSPWIDPARVSIGQKLLIRVAVGCVVSALALPVAGWADDPDANPDGDPGTERRDTHALSLDAIGMELANPVTSLVSLEADYRYTYYQGSLADASDESAYVLNFRASFPIPLANGNNVLVRLNVPMNGDQPLYEVPGSDKELSTFQIRRSASTLPLDGTFHHYHGHSHLGEVGMDVAYGGVSDSGLITMYGVAAQFPTSQDLSQGIDQTLLGPEIALGQVTDWGLYGGWLTHLTNVAGDDFYDTNMTTLELFFAYGLGNGWQITSNPVLAYDWEGESDNRFFLPVGGGVAKTTRIGRMPLKLGFEVYTYLASPDAIGPDWLLRFSITPAIRNPFLN